jgi:hypothetical protein
MRKHLVIPDGQVIPGISLDHWSWLGKYAAEKRPDVIVQLGDLGEFSSLSEYDRDSKKRQFYQRSFAKDLEVFCGAIGRFEEAIAKAKDYKPKRVWTEGNHDYRVERFLDAEPRWRNSFVTPREVMKDRGWQVVPYLKPVVVDGVAYCHLFCRAPSGLVTSTKFGAPSAKAQVQREMRSCIAGHKPGLDTHIQPLDAKQIRGVIAGSFYRHKIDYQTPQGAAHWRGVLMLHEVHQGNFDIMEVSINYLKRKYGKK